MKRILIGLCLIALALMPVSALAAEGDAVIARGESIYIRNVFTMDDMLVLVGDEQIYTYQIGDADMTEYAWDQEAMESLGEGESFGYGNSVVFADGGEIRAFDFIMSYSEQGTQIRRTLLSAVELKDGKAVRTQSEEVDWPDELIESYDGQNQYPKSLENMFANNGKLYCTTYGNIGQEIYALDLETMKIEQIEEENARTIMPYTDGGMLIVVNDYNAGVTQLKVYNPETGGITALAQLDNENSSPGYAADLETGDVYVVADGEICQLDLSTGKLGEGLTDMPMSVYSNRAGLILAGQYFVYTTYDGTVIRNMRPEQQPEARLKVYDGYWIDAVTDAYFDYTNSHGNVAVSISRDYQNQTNLVEDMMNRSSNVDIYMLNLSYSSYNALLERGFMAELDGSEKLSALVESMYPAVKKAVMRDNHVVAVPVQANGQMLGVNEPALEKLGLTIEDVPTNWMDFLDFLADELPEHMTEDSGVTLFYDGMSERDTRYQLFSMIFMAYQTYANETMDVASFDTELLRTLLEKLDRIDFAALGLKGDSSEEEAMRSVAYYGDGSSMLFEMGTNVTFGNYYSDSTPLAMSMDANSPAILELDMVAAFVNPFSENVDLAIEFLEQLTDDLPESVWYNFCPDRDEPIRRKNWEEEMKYAQEYYDSMQEAYEEAEEADRQALEESIADAEEWLRRAEEESWEISREQIDWYRSLDENISVSSANWLYQDDSGEAYEMVMQYLQGQTDMRQFLQGLDKKVRMMQMEGY